MVSDNAEKGAVMADVSVEARVEQLIELVDKLKHAEVQLYSGGLIWGDTYEAKKAPIRAMQSELREKLTAALSANNRERAAGTVGVIAHLKAQTSSLEWNGYAVCDPRDPNAIPVVAATSTTPPSGAAVKEEPAHIGDLVRRHSRQVNEGYWFSDISLHLFVKELLTTPQAPTAEPGQPTHEKPHYLNIERSQGVPDFLKGPVPVLYSDCINGCMVRRDDVWLATTSMLARLMNRGGLLMGR